MHVSHLLEFPPEIFGEDPTQLTNGEFMSKMFQNLSGLNATDFAKNLPRTIAILYLSSIILGMIHKYQHQNESLRKVHMHTHHHINIFNAGSGLDGKFFLFQIANKKQSPKA